MKCCVASCKQEASSRVRLSNSWQFDCCDEHAADFDKDLVEVQADLTLPAPPKDHVRLSCGCIVNWLDQFEMPTEEEIEQGIFNFTAPSLGLEWDCSEHGEGKVTHFNQDDWHF